MSDENTVRHIEWIMDKEKVSKMDMEHTTYTDAVSRCRTNPELKIAALYGTRQRTNAILVRDPDVKYKALKERAEAAEQKAVQAQEQYREQCRSNARMDNVVCMLELDLKREQDRNRRYLQQLEGLTNMEHDLGKVRSVIGSEKYREITGRS